jgi:hypothetical protein
MEYAAVGVLMTADRGASFSVRPVAQVRFRTAETRQNVPMNCSLEFHDSRVASVQSSGDQVTIIFDAAYLHRSDGEPGSDKGTGWVQAGSLEFSSASLSDSPDIGEGWIVDGSLRVDGGDELHLIPVPFNVVGNVAATLSFNNGYVLQLQGTSSRLTLIGDARFVEDFPG